MATFHDRTIAPKFQQGLLRSAGSPCRVLTSAEVVDLLSADATPALATVETDFAPLSDRPRPEGVSRQSVGKLAQVAPLSELPAVALARGDIQQLPVVHAGAGVLLPPEPDTASQARALHMRREMRESLEYGFALMDALGLPPLALDVIDGAIAHLDALDAPGEDLEPSLGWTESGPRFCGDYQDCEIDTADAEPDLATPEQADSSQLRWAQGAHHDGEVVNEDGDDCGEADTPWWDRIGYPVMEGAHV